MLDKAKLYRLEWLKKIKLLSAEKLIPGRELEASKIPPHTQ
jgi:hypothetical protein